MKMSLLTVPQLKDFRGYLEFVKIFSNARATNNIKINLRDILTDHVLAEL